MSLCVLGNDYQNHSLKNSFATKLNVPLATNGDSVSNKKTLDFINMKDCISYQSLKSNEETRDFTNKVFSLNTIEISSQKRIGEIAAFKDGWDGYEAKTIPKQILLNAVWLLYSTGYKSLIMPTARPSLILKFVYQQRELYIELRLKDYTVFIYNQGGSNRDLDNISYEKTPPVQIVRNFFGNFYNAIF